MSALFCFEHELNKYDYEERKGLVKGVGIPDGDGYGILSDCHARYVQQLHNDEGGDGRAREEGHAQYHEATA